MTEHLSPIGLAEASLIKDSMVTPARTSYVPQDHLMWNSASFEPDLKLTPVSVVVKREEVGVLHHLWLYYCYYFFNSFVFPSPPVA